MKRRRLRLALCSGSSDQPSDKYYKAAKVADALARDVHYTVDEKQRNVLLTEDGYEAVEDVLGVPDLYDPRTQWASYVINGLKAKELFARDVNYIVKNGEITIVDEFTGRTMPGRRWSEGLHQAVEAKEGLEVQAESITLASVSYQAFFRAYPKLAGMTGTAATEVCAWGWVLWGWGCGCVLCVCVCVYAVCMLCVENTRAPVRSPTPLPPKNTPPPNKKLPRSLSLTASTSCPSRSCRPTARSRAPTTPTSCFASSRTSGRRSCRRLRASPARAGPCSSARRASKRARC